MTKLLVIYRKPKDAAAFDAYYAATHIPLAQKIPGLKRYEVSKGAVAAPGGGASDAHLVATLHFASMADLNAALGSAEGKAAAGDLANFADGGAELLVFEDAPV